MFKVIFQKRAQQQLTKEAEWYFLKSAALEDRF